MSVDAQQDPLAVEHNGTESEPKPAPEPAPLDPPNSLQAELRAIAARKQHARTEDFEIPGFGGRLWGTFRALDQYGDIRRIVKANERVADPELQEMYTAADTLVEASVTTFAVQDGQKIDLNVRFGLPLADYLGLVEGPMTDRQAVFLLFERVGTVHLMTLFAEHDQFIKRSANLTQRELVGESEAAS